MEQRKPLSSITKEEEEELRLVFKECIDMDGETASTYVAKWFADRNFDMPAKTTKQTSIYLKPCEYRMPNGETKWQLLLTKDEVNACYAFTNKCRIEGKRLPIPQNVLNKLAEMYISANNITVNGGGT